MVDIAKFLKSHVYLILAIIVLVFISSMVAANLTVDGDEIANLEVSRNIFRGYHTETVYAQWKFWHHPPLYYFLIYPLRFSFLYARMFSIAISCMIVILLYKMGGGKAQLLYVLIPTVLIFSAVVRPDILMLLFMFLTLFLVEKHPKLALLVSILGINTKYQYAAVLLPILLVDKRKFVKFVVTDFLAILPFGLVSYAYSGDFLMLGHWTAGIEILSFTELMPTDLMLIYMFLVAAIASLKINDSRRYLALSIANLLLVSVTSPAKFAYKVTYYYLPVFASGCLATEELFGRVGKYWRYVLLFIFLAIVSRQSRFLFDILLKP